MPIALKFLLTWNAVAVIILVGTLIPHRIRKVAWSIMGAWVVIGAAFAIYAAWFLIYRKVWPAGDR